MTHVLVIGAGPAGLAAATTAAEAGAAVTLLDSAADVGGQFWRHLPDARTGASESRLHHRWNLLASLQRAVAERVEVVCNAQVWSWEPDPQAPGGCAVHVVVGPADSQGAERRTIRPDTVVLATGAHDRTLPVPGWDLPGVFTGGAAQTLAKAERVRIGERVVVAGAGPFLLPVAASVLESGGRVVSVHEANRLPALTAGWLARPWGLVSVAGKAAELVEYAGDLLRHRVPYRVGTGVVAVEGVDRVEAVIVAELAADWSTIPGTEIRIAADAVCLTHGFTPRLELAVAAGCVIDDGFVRVDADQRTTAPSVFAAGEITGIGGADLALAEGAIAGWAAAATAAEIPAVVRRARRRREVLQDFAARLHAAHQIRTGWPAWLHDDTVVCRCEETTAGEVRSAAAHAIGSGLRALRLVSRAGLGICQGRICGDTVHELLTAARGETLADVGAEPGGRASFHRRPIINPQRLGDLAEAFSESPSPTVSDSPPSTGGGNA